MAFIKNTVREFRNYVGGDSQGAQKYTEKNTIVSNTITGVAIAVLLLVGAALLVGGGMTGLLPLMMAGGAIMAFSVPLALVINYLCTSTDKKTPLEALYKRQQNLA